MSNQSGSNGGSTGAQPPPVPDNASIAKLGFGAKQSASGGEGGEAPVKARTKIPQQTIVLMVVLSVSAGAIFGMRKLGMRAGIAMGSELVEYTPPDMDRTKSYERIMGDLARIQNPLDVALGEFGKSPFMLQQHEKPAALDPVAAGEATAEQKAAAEGQLRLEQRKQALAAKYSQLTLQSVMGGKVALARVNGEIHRVGDVVGEEFTIMEIKDRSVTLSADQQRFTLTLDLLQQGPKTPAVKMGNGFKPK